MSPHGRVRHVGVPTAVREEQHNQLRRHLGRAMQTAPPIWAPSVHRWWAEVAAEFDVTQMDDSGISDPNGTVVLVDAFRSKAAAPNTETDGAVGRFLEALGAPAGPSRVVFCEIGSVEGRHLQGAVDPIDVTGLLWAQGLSVIDVDREPVRTAKGTWHVVAGVARRTPEPR